MRILITHHLPLDASPNGERTRAVGSALAGQGHQVRILDLGPAQGAQLAALGALSFSRVLCAAGDSQADLDFDPPRFEHEPGAGLEFSALSDAQLAAYREALRRQLDRDVDSFNPHVIHVQHAWLWGQLALETGVPYIISAFGPELAAALLQPRFRNLAQQAVENAGRIIAPDAHVATRVRSTFDVPAERVVILPSHQPPDAAGYGQLYHSVWQERFGQEPE